MLLPGDWHGPRGRCSIACTDGTDGTVIVGVAGSGKTTALDAATTALESAGYRVLGSSTSGQAARTVGTEAGIESRVLASLLWRLNHHQITLDDRTVVLVDEGGIADDADLARLTPSQSLEPTPTSSSSAITASSPPSAPAVPSPPSSNDDLTSSPPSRTTSASATPPNDEPSPSCRGPGSAGTTRWPKASSPR